MSRVVVGCSLFFLASVLQPLPASAQSAAGQAEIIGYHQLCEQGDRKACIRFGMLIEHARDMHAEWRRTHPEWFWWDQ